jgi:hypothetical protein
MVVWVEIETSVIGKSGTKWEDGRGGGAGGKRGMEAAGFCGPCMCLGIFALL